MLMILCISFAVLTVASPAVVLVRSRRRPAPNRASPANRHRAVLEDCGDDVVWEAGKHRSIAATPEFQAKLREPSFLQRLASRVSARSLPRLASRAKRAEVVLEVADVEMHLDSHTDSNNGDGSHSDSGHSDSPSAIGAVAHNARDIEMHADSHTDSNNGDGSHSDSGHTDSPSAIGAVARNDQDIEMHLDSHGDSNNGDGSHSDTGHSDSPS
jgi:hypothetical protein